MSEQQMETQPGGVETRESAGESATSSVLEQASAEQANSPQQTQTEGGGTGAAEKTGIAAEKSSESESGEKGEKSLKESEKRQGAPEEYGEFTVPEVFKLEGQDLTDFKSFAKEQDLTQEQAQKVLDFAGPKLHAMVEQPYKAWNELQAKWQAEVKSDPEIGGTKYEQSVKEAGNVFVPGESNPFVGSDGEAVSLREALNATGAGNNPAIVKLFVKMGRLLAEPGHLRGKPVSQSRQDALLNSLYPTMGEG